MLTPNTSTEQLLTYITKVSNECTYLKERNAIMAEVNDRLTQIISKQSELVDIADTEGEIYGEIFDEITTNTPDAITPEMRDKLQVFYMDKTDERMRLQSQIHKLIAFNTKTIHKLVNKN